MPELPEVETIVRDLQRPLAGATIRGVDILSESAIAVPTAAEFAAKLPGRRIQGVDRRGKFIILRLEPGVLLVHLRMTGRLLLATNGAEEADPPHLRVALQLDRGRLLFVDTRKFGRLYLAADANAFLGSLGAEPLDPAFTPTALGDCLQGRRACVKSILLDQRVVAGIGNIYADEALFAAGISPARAAGTLSEAEVEALHSAIRSELQRGIHHRGTTFSDYRDAHGRRGGHREFLRVYGRAGQPCSQCGAEIQRSRLGGRSSHYCPRCQR